MQPTDRLPPLPPNHTQRKLEPPKLPKINRKRPPTEPREMDAVKRRLFHDDDDPAAPPRGASQ